MPYAKFSPDNIIAETLRDLGLSVNIFHALQHEDVVGKTCIERSVNGTRELDSRTEAPQLKRLAHELRALQESAGVPIDWRNVRAIRECLTARRERDQFSRITIGRIVIGRVVKNNGEEAQVSFRTEKGVPYTRIYERGGDIPIEKFHEYFPISGDKVFYLPTRGNTEIVIGGCI
jgi:hypothetical protein